MSMSPVIEGGSCETTSFSGYPDYAGCDSSIHETLLASPQLGAPAHCTRSFRVLRARAYSRSERQHSVRDEVPRRRSVLAETKRIVDCSFVAQSLPPCGGC